MHVEEGQDKVSDGRRKEHDRQVHILVFQKEKGQVQVPAFDSSDTSRFKPEGKTCLREEQKQQEGLAGAAFHRPGTVRE